MSDPFDDVLPVTVRVDQLDADDRVVLFGRTVRIVAAVRLDATTWKVRFSADRRTERTVALPADWRLSLISRGTRPAVGIGDTPLGPRP